MNETEHTHLPGRERTLEEGKELSRKGKIDEGLNNAADSIDVDPKHCKLTSLTFPTGTTT
jgi:hypothetical protein